MVAKTTAVDARPTKKFFINNLTRDLSLEDAILDLVDNSIDAFIRTFNVDVSHSLLDPGTAQEPEARVFIEISRNGFVIEDKCGGIDRNYARDKVFRFGRPPGASQSSLGVYGIGLKRAIFKLGRKIVITSETQSTGFRVPIDVDNWEKTDDDWTLPLEETPPAPPGAIGGTRIEISELTLETLLRLDDGTFLNRLTHAIGSTYSPSSCINKLLEDG